MENHFIPLEYYLILHTDKNNKKEDPHPFAMIVLIYLHLLIFDIELAY